MSNIAVGITGTGSYVPHKILTNKDLETMVDTSDEWIRTRTGISERRIVVDETTSDLGYHAALRALQNAGVDIKDVDLIVATTSSPDMIFPSTACIIQQKLGSRGCPAFDVMAACTGFSYGLSVAAQFVMTGAASKVLYVCADAMSRFINWNDRNTCVLFGDGAGALVLEPAEAGYGLLGSYLAADGQGADLLGIPAGGATLPCDTDVLAKKLQYIQMNGREVFKFAVRAIPEAVQNALDEAGLKIDDVDYLIPHQANIRIIDAAAGRLGFDMKQVVLNLEKYGNTSTASIPLALDELRAAGKLKRDDILLFVGFGAGLTWGANVVRWI